MAYAMRVEADDSTAALSSAALLREVLIALAEPDTLEGAARYDTDGQLLYFRYRVGLGPRSFVVVLDPRVPATEELWAEVERDEEDLRRYGWGAD